ncbi:hypothetical protein DSL50_14995, partial [Mycobacterium tuberculosis]
PTRTRGPRRQGRIDRFAWAERAAVAAGLGTKLILLLWDSGSDLKGINQLKQWCGLATRVCLGAYQLEDTP